MDSKITLRNIIVSQYGSIRKYTDKYSDEYGRLSYVAMLNRINHPDGVPLGDMRKMLSLLDLSSFSNPYSIFLG